MLEKVEKITREDEANLPEFASHAAARRYFVARYGGSFVSAGSFLIGDRRVCHEYHLVLDRDMYISGMTELRRKGGMSDAGEFLRSFQKVEIMNDGSVHVLY